MLDSTEEEEEEEIYLPYLTIVLQFRSMFERSFIHSFDLLTYLPTYSRSRFDEKLPYLLKIVAPRYIYLPTYLTIGVRRGVEGRV